MFPLRWAAGNCRAARAERGGQKHHHAHPFLFHARDLWRRPRGRPGRVHPRRRSPAQDRLHAGKQSAPSGHAGAGISQIPRPPQGVEPQPARERVESVIAQCGLAEASRRIIGQLSKGFRQRVGLADALVHEPELVILDEPTIGLDPSQIRAVRQMIKDLGGRHTVLLSSHILPEVEMTCNRVIILREGRILAADTPENLEKAMSSYGQIIAEIAAPVAELKDCWEQMAEVAEYDISPAEGEYHRCALTAATAGICARIFLRWSPSAGGSCANSPAAAIPWKTSTSG